MKIGIYLKEAVSALMLTLFCLNFGVAQEGGGNIWPPQVIKTNWGGMPMEPIGDPEDGRLCVKLGSDNILHLNIYVSTATNDLESQPPMYVYYSLIGTGLSDFVEVTGSQMVQNQYGVWVATFNIDYDMSYICGFNGDPEYPYVHNFTFLTQLLTPHEGSPTGYKPYVTSNQYLWPTSIFGFVQSPDPIHTVTKEVCCDHTQPKRLVVNDDGNVMDAASTEAAENQLANVQLAKSTERKLMDIANGVKVAPNPFNDELTVQYIVDELGIVKIECLDANGKAVKTSSEVVTFVGQQTSHLDLASIPTGFYYLRISTTNWTKTVKMIKAGN